MEEKYEMEMYDGHVIMKINRPQDSNFNSNSNSSITSRSSESHYVCLIDTGSPSSSSYYGEKVPLVLMGEEFKMSKTAHGIKMNEIIKLVGTHIDYFIGFSILHKFITKIDVKNAEITLRRKRSNSQEEEEEQEQEDLRLASCDVQLSFSRIMQVPVIYADLIGVKSEKRIKCFFDTGAKLSYIHSKILRDPNLFAVQGTNVGSIKKDFSPFIGHFDTTVFTTKISLINSKDVDNSSSSSSTDNKNDDEDSQLIWEVGTLPSILEASFLSHCDGILGTTIFQHFPIIELDYSINSLYLWKPNNPN